jgi:hypothetical protein
MKLEAYTLEVMIDRFAELVDALREPDSNTVAARAISQLLGGLTHEAHSVVRLVNSVNDGDLEGATEDIDAVKASIENLNGLFTEHPVLQENLTDLILKINDMGTIVDELQETKDRLLQFM